DYHSAGHNSYRCQQPGNLPHTGPMALYLTLVSLIGSRNHARIIFNLVSSASPVIPATEKSVPQELFDALLKCVLKARIGLDEKDPSILDATTMLTSSITDNERLSSYPCNHFFNILAKVARTMSSATLDSTATNEVVTLPQTIMHKYVQSYWEGWVKSLRVVAREPVQSSVSKKRLRNKRESGDGSVTVNRVRRSRLDWRDRWLFVENGMLSIRKERDPRSIQLFPLDFLTEIRGSEGISRSFTAPNGNPLGMQRIICVKFEQTATSTKHVDPLDPTKVKGNQPPPVEVRFDRHAQSRKHEASGDASRFPSPVVTDSPTNNNQSPHPRDHDSYGERPVTCGLNPRPETDAGSHTHEWIIIDLGGDY
ncbi:hypothetical protein PQX77_007696, partial [Marasmius sp. AFHP31]